MINVNKLKKNAEERKKFKKKCFKKILDMCLTKIEIVSQTDTTSTWFEIPIFILGSPSFEIEDCANYITNKLKKNGFKVFFLKPNFLFVNWLI
jgi:archaellum component FlaF (FlaF/FlaG flagellin family)